MCVLLYAAGCVILGHRVSNLTLSEKGKKTPRAAETPAARGGTYSSISMSILISTAFYPSNNDYLYSNAPPRRVASQVSWREVGHGRHTLAGSLLGSDVSMVGGNRRSSANKYKALPRVNSRETRCAMPSAVAVLFSGYLNVNIPDAGATSRHFLLNPLKAH
eukprot:6187938-Pleurochrysis_carterae.AAC.1